MSKIIAKISLICWGFVAIFANILILAIAIPQDFLPIASIILGLIISVPIGINIYRIYRRDGFDFGWFFFVRKGFWRVLLGLTGISLLSIGLFAAVFPKLFNELGENYAMAVAKSLVAMFWLALISTFLGWALICFSEAVGYLRLKDFKAAAGGFALGLLWQLFSLLFSYLFLEVINDVFFRLSASVENWTLIFIAVSTIIIGLLMGGYEDLKPLTADEEK
jgi:hypothetical protein